jgi:tRNA (guanine-N7-)-methyltransferase
VGTDGPRGRAQVRFRGPVSAQRGTPTRLSLYGRRRGRGLRPGRRDLLSSLLPRLRIAPPVEGRLDAARLFGRPLADLWLEIGFGGGEHLVAQARRNPDVGFLGCEPFVDGVAGLLAHVAREGIDNVRILDDDGRLLLEWLPDAALGRVFVLFCDPWPKRRHHKRRLLQADVLDALARTMRDGAELRFATDHAEYAAWSLERVRSHRAFAWPARTPRDWREPPVDGVATRYEEKAWAAGRPCVYLSFLRRPRAAR